MSDLVNGKGGTSLDEFTFLLGACRVKPDEFDYLKRLFLESIPGLLQGHRVGIRDSKAPATHLPVSPAAWTAFLRSVSNRGRA
jgi:hypothetical protein